MSYRNFIILACGYFNAHAKAGIVGYVNISVAGISRHVSLYSEAQCAFRVFGFEQTAELHFLDIIIFQLFRHIFVNRFVNHSRRIILLAFA